MKNKNNSLSISFGDSRFERFVIPVSIIILAVLLRLVPHMPNFTPVAGMALFGGVYLPKRLAVFLPLIVMFIADLFIGFHSSMPYVYGGILVTVFLGFIIRKKPSIFSVFIVSFTSSVIFFLITNFGFFLSTSLYPKTFEGQITAYVMAIPFFRNSLMGDFFYTAMFFGGYYLVRVLFYEKGVRFSADIYKKRG